MMNAQLFPNLPEQREGPITVDGRTLVACGGCDGTGLDKQNGFDEYNGYDPCRYCNGGGVVLVRA